MKRIVLLCIVFLYALPLYSKEPQNTYPVIDLHCDMLYYLYSDRKNKPTDAESRCSIEQMRRGNVAIQTFPIFSIGNKEKGSKDHDGVQMSKLFSKIIKKYDTLVPYKGQSAQSLAKDGKIAVIAAVENGNIFCLDDSPIKTCMKNLKKIHKNVRSLLYIGLNWYGENRFGGGSETEVGMKEDAKPMIDYMAAHGIPYDISHASDQMARDVLAYIDEKGYNLPVIASHSVFRGVHTNVRNLPVWLAREVQKRGGVIGLNFVNFFTGKKPEKMIENLDFAYRYNLQKITGFGADFFPSDKAFYDEYADASFYPHYLAQVKMRLRLNESQLEDLSFKNIERFLYSVFPPNLPHQNSR
jgi:membrane dipeptidase